MRIDWTLLNDDLKAAASLYTRAGLAVFPLVEGGKRPLTGHGFKDATTDRQLIARWWSRWPQANVGLRIPPGVVVIDFDSREAFDRLTTGEFGLPTTVAASTGRGRHLWYRTGARPIPRKIGLLDDVDILVRGYVVAPPSIHGPTGNRYRWIVPPDDDAVLPCPDWLLRLIDQDRRTVSDGEAHRPVVGLGGAVESREWHSRLSEAVGEGSRNTTLAQVAGYFFRHLEANVAAEVTTWWAKLKLRPPLTEEEVFRTINSIAGCEARRRRGEQ